LSDAAFENGDAIADGDQVSRCLLRDDLGGVRVVQDDFAIRRETRANYRAGAGSKGTW
jgi:hypothetical protein